MAETFPCDVLPTVAPVIGDALSAPSEEAVLQQVLAVLPRGEAWGTDEAGDGKGASPEQLKIWRSIAAWVASAYAWSWEVTTQAFPSSITFSLTDWEQELGLPDPCGNPPESFEARKRAVRARLAAIGGASPAYFICVARLAGYDITIEEPTAFECGASECGGPDQCTSIDEEHVWVVRPEDYRMFEFECGSGGGEVGDGGTRLVSYTDITGLECALRRISPTHTQLVFVAA